MSKTQIRYTHDFSGVAAETIFIEVFGDDADDALATLMKITDGLHITVPWKAKVTLSEVAKPITKAEVKKDPSLSGKYDLDEALKILTKTYSSAQTREETKGLLTKYGITKFGDVPLDKANELHADAKLIYAKISQ